eukprot:15436354-Alexandrium_andersonii.AAC.1
MSRLRLTGDAAGMASGQISHELYKTVHKLFLASALNLLLMTPHCLVRAAHCRSQAPCDVCKAKMCRMRR